MAMIRFLEGTPGRAARGAAGAALIGLGTGLGTWLGGAWWVLAVVGLVPLVAAAANLCLLAPLFHRPVHPVARTGGAGA